jgi:hypothetical protein
LGIEETTVVKIKGKKRGGTIATAMKPGGMSIKRKGKVAKATTRGVAAPEPEPKSMYSLKTRKG